MPLVANSGLPTFHRLEDEGYSVLSPERAEHQDIRVLHFGLLNMMPDGALQATERQFFRLLGNSNLICQFHMHPFTLPGVERGPEAAAHIAQFYDDFEQLKKDGLDGLIITGATPKQPDISRESYFEPLCEVVDWARENVTSILCSCLASHALLNYQYGIGRRPLGYKRWGVYPHRIHNPKHPLTQNINAEFHVAHSRYNQVDADKMRDAGLQVLVESDEAGVHIATSPDGFRFVYFQAHPEYDTYSLLKEYKREVMQFIAGNRPDYPPFVDNYFSLQSQAILTEYRERVEQALSNGSSVPEFPETLIQERTLNVWRDTSKAIMSNWVGKVYELTNVDRKLPFMQGIDPENPLGL